MTDKPQAVERIRTADPFITRQTERETGAIRVASPQTGTDTAGPVVPPLVNAVDPRTTPRRIHELPWEARQALLDLESLMETDGHGHGPAGEPEFLIHRRLMLTCKARDMPDRIAAARAEYRAIFKREAPPVGDYDARAAVLDDSVGLPPEVVAQSRHRTAPSTLRKWRREAGCNPETGLPIPGSPGSVDARILELANEGKPVRLIALTVGVPKSTVHDLLVRSAA